MNEFLKSVEDLNSELFQIVIGMDMVIPEKETDFMVVKPKARPHHRPMTRGERRDRTIRKALSRQNADRKLMQSEYFAPKTKLGRYFKAKANEPQWWHERTAYGKQCKDMACEKETAVISRGLAEYYADETVITKEPVLVADRYEVRVGNSNTSALVASVDTFEEADQIASCVAKHTRQTQKELRGLYDRLRCYEREAESLRSEIREIQAASPIESGWYPSVVLEGLNDNSEIVAYEFYYQ